MILTALDHYYENEVKEKPSASPAARAIELGIQFLQERLLPTASVAEFGPLRQKEFMNWSRARFDHTPSTIARNLSVFSAAFRFGRKLVDVKEFEVQLLSGAPDVVTQANAVAKALNLPEPKPREWTPTFEEFGRLIDGLVPRQENLFRFVMIALNTLARPEAMNRAGFAGGRFV